MKRNMDYEKCEVYQIKKSAHGICIGNVKGEPYDEKCDTCPAYIRYKEVVEKEQGE